MRFRFVLLTILALGLIGGVAAGHDKKGKQPKKIDPHWMSYKTHKGPHTIDCRDDDRGKKHKDKSEIFDFSVSALRGPSATDVFLSIETDDPVKFPIPEQFEKLHIKILSHEGKVLSVKKFKDVTITGGEAVVSIPDLYPPMTIMVQAEVKIRRKREEVLRGSATVVFRPDLIVHQVQSPEQVAPNTPFNIQAVIKETKQTDVTANVNLCEGATVLSTASGVFVPAGDQVTVFFEAIAFADAGTRDLTIKITDAIPAEYDTGNNEFAFSVLVTNPVQPVNYTLTYYYTKNYVSSFGYSYCEDSDVAHTEGSFTSWDMTTNLPFVTTSPIDSIRWEAVSGNGTLTRGFISEFYPSVSNPDLDYYNAYIPDDDGSYLYLTMYAFKTSGQSTLSFSKVANNYFYVQIFNGDTTSVYEQEQSHQGDLVGFLEVRVLFADDGQLAGGSARVDMAPFEPVSYDNSYSFDDGSCIYQYIDVGSFEYSNASGSGTTNPAVLPTGSLKGAMPALASSTMPEVTDLVQNYPNPFNPSTNIQFTVEHSGPAVLKVYDMLGKEVTELYRGEAEQGRTYRFTFQAANFASGMYYAKLEAGGRQYTKKMILMK